MKHEEHSATEVHRTTAFGGGIKALFSTALFGTIGTVAGYYLGKWGEDLSKLGGSRGMSTALLRWSCGIGLGGLAAYVTMREASVKEIKQDKETAAAKDAKETVRKAEGTVDATSIERTGTVTTTALDRAI